MASKHGAEHGADAAHGGGSGLDPMHQFEIVRYVDLDFFGVDASFTNSASIMLLGIIVVGAFLFFSTRGRALVPGRMQSIAELTYEFVANMVRDNVGTAGLKFFPFIFTLFSFILACNMLGMLPLGKFTFTPTSHIIVTFALAMVVFLGVTVVGFVNHGLGFLKYFVPSGVPAALIPLMVIIEVISYLTRPLSLSVRLFANMLAGHTMLKVFGSFVVGLGIIGGWAPFGFMIALTGLEVLVAFLQAYVFAVLTCIYLNDAIHMHH